MSGRHKAFCLSGSRLLHSFGQLFLRTYCIKGTGLGTGDEAKNKQYGPCPCHEDGLDFKWIPKERDECS